MSQEATWEDFCMATDELLDHTESYLHLPRCGKCGIKNPLYVPLSESNAQANTGVSTEVRSESPRQQQSPTPKTAPLPKGYALYTSLGEKSGSRANALLAQNKKQRVRPLGNAGIDPLSKDAQRPHSGKSVPTRTGTPISQPAKPAPPPAPVDSQDPPKDSQDSGGKGKGALKNRQIDIRVKFFRIPVTIKQRAHGVIERSYGEYELLSNWSITGFYSEFEDEMLDAVFIEEWFPRFIMEEGKDNMRPWMKQPFLDKPFLFTASDSNGWPLEPSRRSLRARTLDEKLIPFEQRVWSANKRAVDVNVALTVATSDRFNKRGRGDEYTSPEASSSDNELRSLQQIHQRGEWKRTPRKKHGKKNAGAASSPAEPTRSSPVPAPRNRRTPEPSASPTASDIADPPPRYQQKATPPKRFVFPPAFPARRAATASPPSRPEQPASSQPASHKRLASQELPHRAAPEVSHERHGSSAEDPIDLTDDSGSESDRREPRRASVQQPRQSRAASRSRSRSRSKKRKDLAPQQGVDLSTITEQTESSIAGDSESNLPPVGQQVEPLRVEEVQQPTAQRVSSPVATQVKRPWGQRLVVPPSERVLRSACKK